YVPVDGADARERRRRRDLLLALLNSRLYAVLYRGLFAAVAQSGGYLRLNAPYLRCLPWPEREPSAALGAAVAALETRGGRGTRARLDGAVDSLFGLCTDDRRLLDALDVPPAPTRPKRPRNA
ncbi:MAG: hypothetical protein ACE5G2_09395, partial [Candidatus Krumholzibacteriia bacterium]